MSIRADILHHVEQRGYVSPKGLRSAMAQIHGHARERVEHALSRMRQDGVLTLSQDAIATLKDGEPRNVRDRRVLAELLGRSGASVAQLAKRTRLTRSQVSDALTRLRREGFVHPAYTIGLGDVERTYRRRIPNGAMVAATSAVGAMPAAFTSAELAAAAGVNVNAAWRACRALAREGRLVAFGNGRARRWARVVRVAA